MMKIRRLASKNILLLGGIILAFLLCSFQVQENQKESYITSRMPKISLLDETDRINFMETMKFNEAGALTYWDDDIFEKAYPKGTAEYNEIVRQIVKELGYHSDNIIMVSAEGDEYVIENEVVYDGKGNAYSLDDLKKINGFVAITSLACGHCLPAFKELNQLSKYENKIALVDKLNELEKYKTGYRNNKFGFLDEHWIILDYSNPVVQEFIKSSQLKYKQGFFPYYFVRDAEKTAKEFSNLAF
ncbi:hypothetical protein ACPDHL_03765 [Myroides sp. C15-4]|uniref:hypothetical protein n=1 Tax=Myroides sp. C15-4 TaxID=3400532 RepID=UPI003D2F76DA